MVMSLPIEGDLNKSSTSVNTDNQTELVSPQNTFSSANGAVSVSFNRITTYADHVCI